MISSPLIKVVVSIALSDIKPKLELQISSAQVGFLSGLGTQIHILSLLERIKDIQSSPDFVPLKRKVLFIDSKAAFECVNHEIMFLKLNNSEISDRTVNILKPLYNCCHLTYLSRWQT